MENTTKRQIRVFISSTFRDMQAERDYLVKFTFPILRRMCEERGVTWSEVDLRWGITEEQAREGQVLPICLDEIHNCRPYFIGLLGERYGWVPDEVDENLIKQQPWLAEHLERSVTELEILHGVLNHPDQEQQAFFYFRDPNSIPVRSEKEFLEEATPEEIERFGMEVAEKRAQDRREKLLSMKQRIRQSACPVREGFMTPQELGDWVLHDLTDVIERLYPKGEEPSAHEREQLQQNAYAREKSRLYIGGESYFQELEQAVKDGRSLAIIGRPGSGKTALLAKWVLGSTTENSRQCIISHFCGSSSRSNLLAGMLRYILQELKDQCAIEEGIPEDDTLLRRTLQRWLEKASEERKVVLVVDGIDLLENKYGAWELDWLPKELPQNCLVLLSTHNTEIVRVAEERDFSLLTIEYLSKAEREQFIEKYLAQYSKRLDPQQVMYIVEDEKLSNPFALRIFLSELRQFGIHEQLNGIITQFTWVNSISEMIDLVLGRCEDDFDTEAHPHLVMRAMQCILATRDGISEAELLTILGENGSPLPQRFWAPLHLALQEFLIERDGLLTFSHDFIREKMKERYLATPFAQRIAHFTIAELFKEQDYISSRKVRELPWQLLQVEQWEGLVKLLTEKRFFQAVWESDNKDLLMYWAAIEQHSDLNRVEAYKILLEQASDSDIWLLNWLAIFYENAGYLQEAMQLFERIENICRKTGNLKSLQITLGNQAVIYHTWGRPEKALVLHKEEERICRDTLNFHSLQMSLGNQAAIFHEMGKLQKALELHEEEEKICKLMLDQKGLADSYGNKAGILKDLGRLEEAMKLYKEQETICRSMDDLEGLKASLNNQAIILEGRGNLNEAQNLLTRTEEYNRSMGDKESLQISLFNQANILQRKGDHEQALKLYKQQQQICEELGNKEGLQKSFNGQGVILQSLGRLQEALQLHKKAEVLSRETGNQKDLEVSLGNLALIQESLGDLPESMRLHQEEEKICRQLNNAEGLQRSLGNQAVILRSWGRLDEAMQLMQEQEQICRQLGNREGLSVAVGNQGLILQDKGKLKEAMVLYKEKEEICRQINNPYGLANSLGNQATILILYAKRDEAMQLLKEQEQLCMRTGTIYELCSCWINQAYILEVEGKHLERKLLLQNALMKSMASGYSELTQKISSILNS